MADDRHQIVGEIVHAALGLPLHERGAFVHERCAGDEPLRADVESMLRAAGNAGTFLDRPLVEPDVAAALADGLRLDLPGPRYGIPDGAPTIGSFTLVREIGEGGFGTVWLAERRGALVQRVAIKVLHPGMNSRAVLARFDRERQALAVMNHPNVANVLEGGITPEGRPYLVMEYVQGEPITEYCDRRGLSIQRRLELFIPVCEAVQHAHHKGIIHRDLKPKNVLVTEVEGKAIPKVIDFGVAKLVDQPAPGLAAVSMDGQIMGTLEYMSPEQAGGLPDVDTRTDVYALGVMLFELLVGRLPFESKRLNELGHDEARRVIREEEPPRPGVLLTASGEEADRAAATRGCDRAALRRELQRDIEWLLLKAIRKDRERRYASPRELVDDIRCYLEGRALRAAPESRTYRARKFVTRHRGPVVATMAVLAALAIAAWAVGRAGIAHEASLRDRDRAEYDRYHAALSDAQFALDANDVVTARAQLDQAPARLRGWEWHYLRAATDDAACVLRADPGTSVQCVALSPDGSHVAAGLNTGVVVVWNWRTRAEPTRLVGHVGIVESVAFDADGRHLVSAARDATARLWEVATGRETVPAIDCKGPLSRAELSPDGEQVIAIREGGGGLVIDRRDGRLLRTLGTQGDMQAGPRRTCFSRDLSVTAAAGSDGAFGAWRVLEPRSLISLAGLADKAPVGIAAVSADGRRVAHASDRRVQLWSLAPGVSMGASGEHEAGVCFLAFSPDGERLVSASLDGTARVWGATDKGVLQVLRGHDGPVVVARFVADGEYVVTASHDKTLRLWNSHDGRPVVRLRGHEDRLMNLELSADGAWAVTSDQAGAVRVWDIWGATAVAHLGGQPGNPTAATFSPDGRRVVIPSSGGPSSRGVVAVWDTTSARKLCDLLGHTGDVWSAVFSTGGSRVVTASQDGTARVWDIATRRCLVLRHDDWVNWACFSPDDARVVTASGDRSARVWDATDGRQLLRLDHPDRVRCAAYSPLEPWIATACDDGAVYLWDAISGAQIRKLLGHGGAITSLAYGLRGGRLASASEDGTVRLWDPQTGRTLVTLEGHTKRVMSVTFSPDESRIVTASWDQSVRVWDPATGKEMVAFRDSRRDATWATFSPDGNRLLTTYQGGAVLLRDQVPPDERTAGTPDEAGDEGP